MSAGFVVTAEDNPELHAFLLGFMTPPDPASDPACDVCGFPITEDPHTPADLTFHPECCPDPDCPQNESGQ